MDAFGNEFTFHPIVHVIQLQNGATFIGQVNNLDNYDIKSITLDSVYTDNYAHFTPNNSVDGSAMITCFVAGTRILTTQGEVAIEDLQEGDMIITMDHGLQPIRWIGSSKCKAIGKFALILIRKGALGNTRDLRVSPQHRMFYSSAIADLLFHTNEVLIPAKSLLNDHSIIRDEGGAVEYYHMLFDTHEIIYAEGAPSESGPVAGTPTHYRKATTPEHGLNQSAQRLHIV